MLIQITNTCTFGCPHCLHDSTPDPQHMKEGLFRNALIFSRMAKCDHVMLTGGEPTDHPQFEHYLDLACDTKYNQSVHIITNGKWLGTEMEDKLIEKMSNYRYLTIQITNDNRYYPGWSRKELMIPVKFDRFMDKCVDKFGAEALVKIAYCSSVDNLVTLGRCKEVKALRKIAKKSKVTTSCFASIVVAAQAGPERFIEAIGLLESRNKWCHPLIDWCGGIHWSESWLCPSFFTIPSHLLLDKPMFLQIVEAACAWRPCGKCRDFQKVFEHNEPQYVLAREILGITSKQQERNQSC